MAPPVKAVLLFFVTIVVYLAAKPPNPPPTKDDKVKKGTFFEKGPRVTAWIARNSAAVYLVLECTVLLLPGRSPLRSTLCPISQSATMIDISTLSVSFLTGITMMSCGAALRLWCFRALGKFFTFEVTIRPDHKLVTTGPYAYVRHPSYAGSLALLIGATVVQFSKHSYINECGIMSTRARWVVVGMLAFKSYLGVFFWRRGRFEDEALKAAFGPTWEQYHRAVPYRFIPGLV